MMEKGVRESAREVTARERRRSVIQTRDNLTVEAKNDRIEVGEERRDENQEQSSDKQQLAERDAQGVKIVRRRGTKPIKIHADFGAGGRIGRADPDEGMGGEGGGHPYSQACSSVKLNSSGAIGGLLGVVFFFLIIRCPVRLP
jgi:hypothetical protein